MKRKKKVNVKEEGKDVNIILSRAAREKGEERKEDGINISENQK